MEHERTIINHIGFEDTPRCWFVIYFARGSRCCALGMRTADNGDRAEYVFDPLDPMVMDYVGLMAPSDAF